RRREERGFAGADRILAELDNGAPLKRVGFTLDGRQPVREGAVVLDGEGNEIGRVTSGGFSPSLERPIGMAYIATAHAVTGATINFEQRGKLLAATISAMPFVPHRYHRKPVQGA
ncbi:MAG: glycine cleavage system protein T, partial [Pseudomonadota bacterium]|nr:glycine cleavage system protein T [Pseudomonadota bacterium]